jgi:hypothetical protein
VDISKTGITLINNLVGMLPVGLAAYAKGETWCQVAMGFQGWTEKKRWGYRSFYWWQVVSPPKACEILNCQLS